jgi:Family of unknown function (DUF6064)
MADLLTYALSDFLLFSRETYNRLFELHNEAVWPAQLVAVALGIAILALLRWPSVRQGRAITAALAACWLWVAWAFHLERYATINWAATYFAAAFALQALLLAWWGVVRGRLVFWPGRDRAGQAGLLIFAFALAVQPLVGPLAGRAWPGVEVFGVAPDPTVVATLGLLLAAERTPWGLAAIPVLWCAVGGATLWAMESPGAVIMPLAAVLFVLLAAWKANLRSRSAARVGAS